MHLSGKCAVVVGLGASGIAAARLCLRRGARVVGTDTKRRDELSPDALALEKEGVTLRVGKNDLEGADIIVVSPGVPPFPANAPIVGEVELAFQCLAAPAPVLAIGGTNGKSTTTTLVGELLQTKHARTFMGGNLGEPLAAHVDEPWDAIVLEVSSFQMEHVDRFRPKVGALLNVTADHLDRYASFDAYADAKGNCFLQQTKDDVAVVPHGDAVCERQARRGQGRVVTFGPSGDVDVTADAIRVRETGAEYKRSDVALKGGHNALNVAAALACALPFGLDDAKVRAVLAAFKGLAHRMALVAEIEGVRFYDDSKGTNVGATVTALAGIAEPRAVLIAGGKDKGGSYAPLADALRSKGRAVVVIGEAALLIEDAVADVVPVFRAASMDEAVGIAAKMAKPGDAVLLSPACSSFDMFRDYKHRGDEFVASVGRLGGKS